MSGFRDAYDSTGIRRVCKACAHEGSTEAEEAREEGAAEVAQGATRRQGREEEGAGL